MKTAACVAVLSCAAVFGAAAACRERADGNAAVAGGLDSTFRGIVAAQSSPAWIGYSVPMIPASIRLLLEQQRDVRLFA